MTVRRLRSALLVALTGLAVTVVASNPAGAADQPSLSASDIVCRGISMPIDGGGFSPGQDYQFSATQGSFETGIVTADPYGQLTAMLNVPHDAGLATRITITAAATSAPDTVVATLTVSGFQPATIASQARSKLLADAYPPNSQLKLDSNCFQPGEGVQLSSPQVSFGPATVKYVTLSSGRSLPIGFFTATVLAVHTTGMATVTVTGMVSGNQATLEISTGGNVLDAGAELHGAGHGQLISASGAYRMLIYSDEILVCHLPPVRPQDVCDQTWASPIPPYSSFSSPGVLQLLPSGALVLLSGGQLVWSTGTVGAGNRLTLRDDGNLALTSARGDLLWSSKTGLVHGAAGAVTVAYIAGSRAGHAVYINGLVKHWAGAGQLVRSPHRLAYLQRYLNRGWQNVLARTTDSNGQLAVGFIQWKACQYRWVVLSAPGLTGAYSASLVR